MAQNIKLLPTQYKESYIPTDIVPIADQALAYNQQRYDTTQQALSKMYQDLYNTPVHDPESFKNEVNAISSRVTDVDNKYNKDLSAGMADYIDLIGRSKQSPYWKLNELAIAESKKQKELEDKYGAKTLPFKKVPNSLITTDVNTGEIRYLKPSEVSSNIEEQLDYTGKQSQLWKDALHEEGIQGGLPKVISEDNPFIEIWKSKGINDKQILNKLEYIRQQYQNTPEYTQQKRKIAELELQGVPKDEANMLAEYKIADDIIDMGRSKKYLTTDSQVVSNSAYNKDSDEETRVLGNPVNDTMEPTFYQQNKKKFANVLGEYTDINKAIKEHRNTADWYDKIIEDLKKSKGIKTSSDFSSQALYENAAKKIKNDINFLENSKELFIQASNNFEKKFKRKPLNDQEIAKFLDQDDEAIKQEFPVAYPILNKKTSSIIRQVVQNVQNASFRVSGKNIKGGSWEDVSKELGIEQSVIRASLDNEMTIPLYNKNTGEFYINIPEKASVEATGKLRVDPSTKYKKLNFTLDASHEHLIKGFREIKDAIATGSKEGNKGFADDFTNPLKYYIFDPGVLGMKSDNSVKRIAVVDAKSNQIKEHISVNELSDVILNITNDNLINNYTKPWSNK